MLYVDAENAVFRSALIRIGVVIRPLRCLFATVLTDPRVGLASLRANPPVKTDVPNIVRAPLVAERLRVLTRPLPLRVVAGAPACLAHWLVTARDRACADVRLSLEWSERVARALPSRVMRSAIDIAVARLPTSLDRAAWTTVGGAVVADRSNGNAAVDQFPAALTRSAILRHIDSNPVGHAPGILTDSRGSCVGSSLLDSTDNQVISPASMARCRSRALALAACFAFSRAGSEPLRSLGFHGCGFPPAAWNTSASR